MKPTNDRIPKDVLARLRKDIKSSISPTYSGLCCVLKCDLAALIKQAEEVNKMLGAIDKIKS